MFVYLDYLFLYIYLINYLLFLEAFTAITNRGKAINLPMRFGCSIPLNNHSNLAFCIQSGALFITPAITSNVPPTPMHSGQFNSCICAFSHFSCFGTPKAANNKSGLASFI